MEHDSRWQSRRHILSSINPDVPSPQSPCPKDAPEKDTSASSPPTKADPDAPPETARPRAKHLRLKDASRPHRRHRRHHGRSRSRSRSPSRSGKSRRRRRDRAPTPPNAFQEAPLSPNAAFLESLYDAMADDEGAEYWQSVYGQPVHTYGGADALENMGEEQYAAYVRRKMWERTAEGMEEERARRRRAEARERDKARSDERRKRKEARREKKDDDDDDDDAHRLWFELGEALSRGDAKRRARMWDRYLARWRAWDGTAERVVWPVDLDDGGGERRSINEADMRAFMRGGLADGEKDGLLARLREERVRWHPDRMQQRLGGTVEPDVMRNVTAVFQIVDKFWSEVKGG